MNLPGKNAKAVLSVLLALLFLAGAYLVFEQWRLRREKAMEERVRDDAADDAARDSEAERRASPRAAETERTDSSGADRRDGSKANDAEEPGEGKRTYGRLSRSSRLKQEGAAVPDDDSERIHAEKNAEEKRNDAEDANQALRWFRKLERPVDAGPDRKRVESKSAPRRTGLHWMRRIGDDADAERPDSGGEPQ